MSRTDIEELINGIDLEIIGNINAVYEQGMKSGRTHTINRVLKIIEEVEAETTRWHRQLEIIKSRVLGLKGGK